MKIITIVGARPQFVKAAMISKAILENTEKIKIDEILVHTGQHYDENMSQIFFEQMGIPLPKYNLEIGSGLHGATTGKMLEGVEKILIKEKADLALVYGDTNSTLAGALAASKLHIPVAHVEAGLRSFNKKMPEEINRVLTDNISSLLLCPTTSALENLAHESITHGVHHVGDVMYDAALAFSELAETKSTILAYLGLHSKSYFLATVHRAENTGCPQRLVSIFEAFAEIATLDSPLVLPLHPRTAACIERQGLGTLIASNPHVRLVDPVSFLDMVMLEKHANLILTDSGGVQKEAYFHGVPCITLRDETEWVETVEAGWNTIASADKNQILSAVSICHNKLKSTIDQYGKGHAAEMIVELLLRHHDNLS
jgi:UDP-GlcNAc3NAcA epimerase